MGVVLTATVAAQLATLPVLLPAFGTVSLTSVPANIVAVPLVAIAMPLAALAAIAGLDLAAARGGHRRTGRACCHRADPERSTYSAPLRRTSASVCRLCRQQR